MAQPYQLVSAHPDQPGVVLRVEDQAFIPFDPANRDYQEFLRFIEDGGVPDPAPEPVKPAPP